MTKTYLLGLLHDATERRLTFRISQNNKEFINFIAKGIKELRGNAWVYKEGKNRKLYIVEFSKVFLKGVKIKNIKDKIDYIRGYFDAEGGIAKSTKVRFYIYFAQKDLEDLREVKSYLEEININCGKIHNPSRRVDPDYWRFFISARSYRDFANKVGSFHPIKKEFLRMKI